jgi:hypothetical protein
LLARCGVAGLTDSIKTFHRKYRKWTILKDNGVLGRKFTLDEILNVSGAPRINNGRWVEEPLYLFFGVLW